MITVYVPGPLRGFSGGRDVVEVTAGGGTLREALAALFALHPGLRDRVLTETGEIRRHVNVFVGADRSTLEAPVAHGDDISILPAVSGG
jgi:molybdopterin converting factor small subunit